jgi:hypothetical protein
MIESGNSAAQLAYDVYIHRLRKYVGAYLAALGIEIDEQRTRTKSALHDGPLCTRF